MRGKVLCQVYPVESLGITPAYAGKSDEFQRFLQVFEDHPRVCGEK